MYIYIYLNLIELYNINNIPNIIFIKFLLEAAESVFNCDLRTTIITVYTLFYVK